MLYFNYFDIAISLDVCGSKIEPFYTTQCGQDLEGVNFINILRTYFCRFGSFFYINVTREKLPKQRLYEKFVRKMLMKLTPCVICDNLYSVFLKTFRLYIVI